MANRKSVKEEFQKFILTEQQARTMDCLLALDGQQYNDAREINEIIYAPKSIAGKSIEACCRSINSFRSKSFLKIKAVCQLSQENFDVLCRDNNWYAKLFSVYSKESFTEIKKRSYRGVPRGEGRLGSYIQLLRARPQIEVQEAIKESFAPQEQDILRWTLGFEKIYLTVRDMFKKLGMTEDNFYAVRRRLTAELCYLLGLSEQSDISPDLAIRHQESELSKRQNKELFLTIQQGPLWQELSDLRKQALIFYYGLDLPGEQMRSSAEVAEILSMTAKMVWYYASSAKKQLNQTDPSLDFILNRYHRDFARKIKNPLEARLSDLVLKGNESQLLSELLFKSVNGISMAELGKKIGLTTSQVFSYKGKALRKLKGALVLPASEFSFLQEIDSWYVVFQWVYPDASWQDIEQIVRQKRGRRRSTLRIANPLESRLDKLVLTQVEASLMSQLLFNGQQQAFLVEIGAKIGLSENQTYAGKRQALTKMQVAFDLPTIEFALLSEMCSWYSELKAIHPDKSWLELQSLAGHKKSKSREKSKPKTEYLGALGSYRKEILSIPEISQEEVGVLVEKIQQGDQTAILELYLPSLRYILPIAYGQTWSLAGKKKALDLLDLIQEGNLGLWMACQRMNYNGDAPWIAYAKATAKGAMKRAIGESMPAHLIYLADKQRRQVRSLIKAALELKEQLGYEPSVAEISEQLGKTIEQTWDIQEAMQIFYKPTISLDSPIKYGKDEEDGRSSWADIIPDTRQSWDPYDEEPDDSESSIVSMFEDYVQTALDEYLSPTEQYVLRLLYGFEEREYFSWPIEKVARTVKLSVNMVRHIEEEALDKLRQDPKVSQRLNFLLKVEGMSFALPIQTYQIAQGKEDLPEESEEETSSVEVIDSDERWENPQIKPKETPRTKLLLKDEQSRHLYKQGLIPALSWYQK